MKVEKMFKTALAGVFLLAATATQADIAIKFVESAPKDSFRIVNVGDCATGAVDITIDLSSSKAGLIFDTTSRGAGVEVFQPFEIVEGSDRVAQSGSIADGDSSTTLSLKDLPRGGAVKFTIDVDDTLTSSQLGQIRVSGSEIEGARVQMERKDGTIQSAEFGADGRATLSNADCPA